MAGDVKDAGSGKEADDKDRPSWHVNHNEYPVYNLFNSKGIRLRYPRKHDTEVFVTDDGHIGLDYPPMHDTQQFLTDERLRTLLYLAYRIMQTIFVMCLLWSYKNALKELQNPYFAVRVLSTLLYRCTQLFITGVVLGHKDAIDIFLGMCRMTSRAFKRVCSDK